VSAVTRGVVVALLVGLVAGATLGLLGPRYWPELTAPFEGKRELVQGEVLREERREDRYLITLKTPEGAILATFRERAAEVDLLVDPGDRVTLALRGYAPFVADPRIARVMKRDQSATPPVAPAPSPPPR